MNPGPDDEIALIAMAPLITLEGEATLREVAQTLDSADIGAVVVLPSDSETVAIVSERDIVRALANGADPDEVWAADVVPAEPRWVSPSQSIRSVGEEMLASGARHLLVMGDGELVGMVGARDVLRIMGRADSDREHAHPGG